MIKTYLPIIILLATTGLVLFGYVHPGHILEGDFSLYFRQAESLCLGDMQKVFDDMQVMLSCSTDKMYSPTLYPWGYPILIAPLYAMFGFNFYPYKIAQWLFINLGILFFYLQMCNLPKFRWQAFLIALIIGMQPAFSTYILVLLSEPSYFFCIMLSVYTMRKVYIDKPLQIRCIPQYIAVGVLFLFTAQVRTEGALLFPALFVLLCSSLFCPSQKIESSTRLSTIRKLTILFIPFFSALILYSIGSAVLPSGFLRHIDHTSLTTWQSVSNNALAYFHDLGKFIPFSGDIGISFFLFLSCGGMIRSYKTHLFEIIFLCLSIPLLLIWPHQNTRHLLALFPFIFFFFIKGVDYIAFSWKGKPLSFYIAILMLALLLPHSVRYSVAGYNSTTAYDKPYGFKNPDYKELVNVVKEKIPLNEYVAFSYNRALYLSTDRISFPAFGSIDTTRKYAQWYIYFRNGGTYFQYSSFDIERYSPYFTQIYKNRSFILYRVSMLSEGEIKNK